MIGKVVEINCKSGMIAVETENGEYSILESLGGNDLDIGDTLSGDLESVGQKTIINKTKSIKMSVFIDDCHCDPEIVRRRL